MREFYSFFFFFNGKLSKRRDETDFVLYCVTLCYVKWYGTIKVCGVCELGIVNGIGFISFSLLHSLAGMGLLYCLSLYFNESINQSTNQSILLSQKSSLVNSPMINP